MINVEEQRIYIWVKQISVFFKLCLLTAPRDDSRDSKPAPREFTSMKFPLFTVVKVLRDTLLQMARACSQSKNPPPAPHDILTWVSAAGFLFPLLFEPRYAEYVSYVTFFKSGKLWS